VVIPNAGSLNSGVVFLALAYGKPVIVPATPGFVEIAGDFGEERVRLFDPPLDAAKLAAAAGNVSRRGAAGAEAGPIAPPQAYTWPVIARQHAEFFERLVLGNPCA
jgi:glycosyltransferase involved in cell wall biosynthesis